MKYIHLLIYFYIFFETYGIWKFISIKNGVISKPATLQNKLIDSFTCDTSFHWKEFWIYYSISWITRSFSNRSFFSSFSYFYWKTINPDFCNDIVHCWNISDNFLSSYETFWMFSDEEISIFRKWKSFLDR